MGNYSSALVPGKPVSFKRVSFWSPVLSSADVCHEEGMNVHALACDGCALTSFFLCFTERHRGVWVNCDGGADSAEVTVRAADSGKYTVHCTLYNSHHHHHLQRAHEEAVLNTVHSLFVCLPTCWLSIIYLLYDLTKVFFFLHFLDIYLISEYLSVNLKCPSTCVTHWRSLWFVRVSFVLETNLTLHTDTFRQWRLHFLTHSPKGCSVLTGLYHQCFSVVYCHLVWNLYET